MQAKTISFRLKMKMTRTKVLLLSLCLMACSDFSFGIIGDKPSNVSAPQRGNECIKDEDCNEGLICYKTNQSYMGACIRVHN